MLTENCNKLLLKRPQATFSDF